MENLSNVSHLDADVLLPPRKRLLAGLRKQNLYADNAPDPSFSGSSFASPFVETLSLSPTFSSGDFNYRLKQLVNSCRNNHSLTPEEIIATSRLEAMSAMKAAEAARATAEEKTAIAAKAIAAARSALALVASFSDEAASNDRNPTKNKEKKHLPVQLLYKKYQLVQKSQRDEELARKLHCTIKRSLRISKTYSNPDSRNHINKKGKSSTRYEMADIAGSRVFPGQDHLSLGKARLILKTPWRKHAQSKKK